MKLTKFDRYKPPICSKDVLISITWYQTTYYSDDLSIIVVVIDRFFCSSFSSSLRSIYTIIIKSPDLFSIKDRNSSTSVGAVIAMTLVSCMPLTYYYWKLITVLSTRYTWTAYILCDCTAKQRLNSVTIFQLRNNEYTGISKSKIRTRTISRARLQQYSKYWLYDKKIFKKYFIIHTRTEMPIHLPEY